jgi:hypothetical protein
MDNLLITLDTILRDIDPHTPNHIPILRQRVPTPDHYPLLAPSSHLQITIQKVFRIQHPAAEGDGTRGELVVAAQDDRVDVGLQQSSHGFGAGRQDRVLED